MSQHRPARPHLLVLLAFAAAAGCECTPATPLPDDGGVVDECERLDVGALQFDVQQDVQTIFSAPLVSSLGDADVPDHLVFHFVNFNERVGPLGAGEFALDDAPNDNRSTCAECVSIFEDQLTDSSVPQAVFFQREGRITLDVNPRTRILQGRLEGVVLEEVTIDGATLESVPVENGRCFTLDDLDLNARYLPDSWTCDAASYQGNDGCQCDCGAPDPDCFCDPFQNPDCPPVIEDDCDDGATCIDGVCRSSCDPFALPTEPCANDDDLCVFSYDGPVCEPANGRINPAPLGAECLGLGIVVEYCGVVNTIPTGVCDDLTNVCRPLCGPAPNDCGDGQSCYTIAGGGPGNGWGFCVDDNGSSDMWECDPDSYDDGATCDCNCGTPDPDCNNDELPVLGCQEGEFCVQGACSSE